VEAEMTITVKKVADDLYMASLTLPDVPNVKAEWTTTMPLTARNLVRELLARGCHSTDIGDAMYEQDPEWIEKSRDPFIPPFLRNPI